MKTLLLVRHAKSSWRHADLADHERPLNKRGKRDAPRMGRLLRDEGLTPDVILSSTAERAQKTAQAITETSGCKGGIELVEDLYHGGPSACITLLRRLPDRCERVAVVGHNPGIEDLLTVLTRADEMLPTAAVAHVVLPVSQWRDLSETTEGTLVTVWRPRELE